MYKKKLDLSKLPELKSIYDNDLQHSVFDKADFINSKDDFCDTNDANSTFISCNDNKGGNDNKEEDNKRGNDNKEEDNKGGNDKGGDDKEGDDNKEGDNKGGNDKEGDDKGGNDKGGNNKEGDDDKEGNDKGGNDNGGKGICGMEYNDINSDDNNKGDDVGESDGDSEKSISFDRIKKKVIRKYMLLKNKIKTNSIDYKLDLINEAIDKINNRINLLEMKVNNLELDINKNKNELIEYDRLTTIEMTNINEKLNNANIIILD